MNPETTMQKIDHAVSQIEVHGARSSESLPQMTGR
jgi:hypothetical protein